MVDDAVSDRTPDVPRPPRATFLARLSGRPGRSVAVLVGLASLGAAAALWRGTTADDLLTAKVRTGTLTVKLTVAGILRPVQSITYRSPLGGREAEITSLVAEGTRVNEGDLLARLDTTELRRDLERAGQELRQAQVDLQVAEIETQEGRATIDSLSEGEGALSVDEANTRLQLAGKKVERLREEYAQLKPLQEKGFITREELRKTGDELEQAEEELALSRRKSEVFIERTHPRDRQRAELQLAQKEAQRENVRARLQEAQAHVRVLQEQIENCSIYARRQGLVVYEEYLGASPRRKVHLGDRVTSSQGLVTIPEVNRMLVEASAGEADVHRIREGQSATIHLEAFPDLRLTGKVTRVGTLARSSADRPFDEKRFDLIVELNPTDADVKPEMTARVDILLGDRPGVLLVPVNAVFEHQGLPVCHVVGPSGLETRPVQLGESNGVDVEVVGGLRDGERVTLTDVKSPATVPTATSPAGTVKSPLMKDTGLGSNK
jgi:multidrug efflux pump subunit AcrA (membrane-fusion protein)